MSSVPARRGSTQCWGAWRAPGAGTRSCRGCRGTDLNTLTLLHSYSHSKTLTISQIGYLHITHYTLHITNNADTRDPIESKNIQL